ncbi:MAG: radical SAM protein [Candidatus Bathyarchaeia archaeon]
MKAKLTKVSWNVTSECNLTCKHCYRDAGSRAPHELTTEEGKRLLEDVASTGRGALVVLSGGEPLMRRDIFELARHGTSLDLRLVMGSNGTLITREVAEELKASGILSVAISLDGARAGSHDSFRGMPGAFEGAIVGAKACSEAGVNLQINITVTKYNYKEVPEILNIAERLGAQGIHLFHFVPSGRGREILESEITVKQYVKLLNYVYKRQRKVGVFTKPTCAPQYWAYLLREHEGAQFLPEFLKRFSKGCLAGTGYCCVTPEGIITPCPYLPVEVGDIREDGFRKLWCEAEVLTELRNERLLKEPCRACAYIDVCRGCRARAFAYYGDYLAPDPACFL